MRKCMLTYLIDDDPISLFLTEQTLRLGGFQAPILPFGEAEEALSYLLPRLATEPPEVIFLDLNMPKMNGWQFLDALMPHVSALLGQCRLYLLTSSLALADTDQTHSYTLISGIIHKPLDEGEVRAILAQQDAASSSVLHGLTAEETKVTAMDYDKDSLQQA
jgi:CheY-like chemotaxis protein